MTRRAGGDSPAPSFATVEDRGSIQFPRRNGEQSQTRITTSTGLYGIFGANVAGGADGAFAFFVQLKKGQLVTQSDSLDLGNSPYVMGMGANTVGRGFSIRYFAEDATAATGTALKGRLAIAGKDHASANHMGRYVGADADGAPSGDVTSGSWLRWPLWTDDVPRLAVVTYTAATLTFRCFMVRLDTFAIEDGDSKTLAAWTGMGTSASRTPLLTVGSYTSAPALLPNYFPGNISDIMQILTVGTDANWQDVAKGKSPDAVFGAPAVARYWRLGGPADLTQTSGTHTAATDFALTGTVRRGQQIRPSLNASGNGLACVSRGDGYLFGLLRGTTSRSIAQDVVVIGSATELQARVSRADTGLIINDWARVTTGAVTGMQTVTVPSIPRGFDYIVELRREDDTTAIAVQRDRVRVGYKVFVVGQSQQDIAMVATANTPGISAPSVSNVSFAVMRSRMKRYRPVDIGVLETDGDLSDAMLALAERLGTLDPTVPVEIVSGSQAGESLGSWYSDQVVYSGSTYKAFGDYTTKGSGYITDVLREAGRDISFFLFMHGTADAGRVYPALMNALFGGVSSADAIFSNQPSAGGPTVTTSVDRYYSGAGLEHPIHVVVVPIQRHADPSTGAPATQVAHNAFRDKYHQLRKYQAEWVPPSGITMEVGAYTHDVMLESAADTAHQIQTDQRGNARIGRRYAMAILRAAGRLAYNPHTGLVAVARTSSTVLTLTFNNLNLGFIFRPGAGPPPGAEVSEDGGSTWSKTGFTPAIASAATMTLTKAGGWSSSPMPQVRFNYGGPIEYFTVSQTSGTRATNYALENVDLDNFLYESFAAAAPSNSSGMVQGVPIAPTYTALTAT